MNRGRASAVPYYRQQTQQMQAPIRSDPLQPKTSALNQAQRNHKVPDSDSEDEISFQSIIRDKPDPEVVAEFLQEYIHKLVNDESDDDSDYMESSEYNTDR